MATLPTYTKTIDNAFVETWYDIKPMAVDNVLLATPIWALLKERGCFVPQRGGNSIERTIKYDNPTALEVVKGDILSQGEKETETAAFWTWRYLSAHIQRSAFDDQKNAGKYQIKDYVKKRTTEAYDALKQRYETDVLRVEVTDESGKNIQSLLDILPAYADRATGTYGGINRSESFWQGNYKQLTTPVEVNLLSDMKNLYNTVFLNQSPPKVMVTTQTLFEVYEEYALDASQIIKDDTTMLADLGFEVLRFKGKPIIWTPNMPTGTLNMYNTDYIEVVYDPGMWFDMTNWKDIPLQAERIAHILCAMNIIGTQPRRHGSLYT